MVRGDCHKPFTASSGELVLYMIEGLRAGPRRKMSLRVEAYFGRDGLGIGHRTTAAASGLPRFP